MQAEEDVKAFTHQNVDGGCDSGLGDSHRRIVQCSDHLHATVDEQWSMGTVMRRRVVSTMTIASVVS